MYYVYILQSEKSGRYYIGSTNDLNRRLIEHNSGQTKSLKYLIPMKLVFSQEFLSVREVRKIEQRLKKFKNKDIIERIIKDGKIIMSI